MRRRLDETDKENQPEPQTISYAEEREACELRSLLWNCRLSYVVSPSFCELA